MKKFAEILGYYGEASYYVGYNERGWFPKRRREALYQLANKHRKEAQNRITLLLELQSRLQLYALTMDARQPDIADCNAVVFDTILTLEKALGAPS